MASQPSMADAGGAKKVAVATPTLTLTPALTLIPTTHPNHAPYP